VRRPGSGRHAPLAITTLLRKQVVDREIEEAASAGIESFAFG
jgi:hypothetical protein